jgi:hypothetical protein
MSCNYSTTVLLPEIRKKIIYLDQFFFSSAFREGDLRFVKAAEQIRHVSTLQLLVAPFSSVHVDETHQWRGYDGKNKDDLMEFIKATSRGHEFKPSYEVEKIQIVRAFRAFLTCELHLSQLQETDVVDGNIHEWDDYFRIDIGRYIGNIELIRDFKQQAVEGLVDLFPSWRQSTNSFDQDVALELQSAAKSYIESYLQYTARVASGDYTALFDSPIISTVVQLLLHCLPDNQKPEDRLEIIGDFFKSPYFADVPYQMVSARIYSKLKDMVKCGAYKNREGAILRLSGFFQDIKHISTYAPYCDAFVMDQAMASLVADRRVGLEDKYNVKVFSLNNWDELFEWLDALERGMSPEHRVGLAAAYP